MSYQETHFTKLSLIHIFELDEVYDISGLPNTAFYVGIRFTAQA